MLYNGYMRSKELKTYNIPSDSPVLSQIDAKPTWLFVTLIILGIVAISLRMEVIYGITLIIVGIVGICFMPRITLIEFYSDHLVMYNRVEKTNCIIMYYNEIVSWYYTWSATKDYLYIELEDGTIEKIEAFSKTIFEAFMSRYLKDKRKKTK